MASDGNGFHPTKVEKVVESTAAKFVTRVIVPVLLSAIIAMGLEVRADIRSALSQLNAQAIELAVLKQRVQTLEAMRR